MGVKGRGRRERWGRGRRGGRWGRENSRKGGGVGGGGERRLWPTFCRLLGWTEGGSWAILLSVIIMLNCRKFVKHRDTNQKIILKKYSLFLF